MSDYLPQELIISVLVKLPIKSLLQCSSVCKSWHSLITSQSFITTHLHHQKPHLLLRQHCEYNNTDRFSLCSDSESLHEIQHLYFSIKRLNQFFRITGSCHGLLCLSDDIFSNANTIILWNPMIRKSVTLPCPRINYVTHGRFRHLLGFGFDSRTNDYKVVKITYLESDSDIRFDLVVPPEVDVYSLSTRSWLQISATAPPYQASEFYMPQAYMDGSVHWIVYKPEANSKNGPLIMLFDMSTEMFGEMMLPTSLATGGACAESLSIAVLGESLSVLEFGHSISNCTYRSCAIWMMEEYGVAESWTKRFVVNVDGGFGRILGLRTNGDLLLPLKKGELVSYNPETQQIKKLGIGCNWSSFYFGAYTESLVLLNEVGVASWEGASSSDMPQTEDGVEGSKNV